MGFAKFPRFPMDWLKCIISQAPGHRAVPNCQVSGPRVIRASA